MPISRTGRDASNPPGMEPPPGADPGLPPYRGRVTAVCDGKALAQAMAVASASRSTGSPCLRRCWLSSVRFERTLPAPHAGASLPLGYEDMEPPPGADPGHPPYESEAAAVRGGVSWGIKIRT